MALRYLQHQGLRLLERNFRCPCGELDLVMQTDSCIVVIEVRYRSNANFGGAAATVTAKKQQRIIKTTQLLLQKKPRYQELSVRFDVVAISGNLDNAEIKWLPHAFSVDGII
jgi:putative endonuclease